MPMLNIKDIAPLLDHHLVFKPKLAFVGINGLWLKIDLAAPFIVRTVKMQHTGKTLLLGNPLHLRLRKLTQAHDVVKIGLCDRLA